MLSRKQQWVRTRAPGTTRSRRSRQQQHAKDDGDLTAAAATAARPAMGVGCIGEEDDCCAGGTRSVSFDEAAARVIFVPTRSELARDDLYHQQQRYHQQHDRVHDLAGRVDCDGGDGGGRNEGIWWTRKDCARFRRSFRRQICAENLKLKSFLCPTDLVYRIGREDELREDEMMMRKKQEEEDDARRREENGVVVVDGAAGAGGNDCGGGGGGCRSLMVSH